jgi:hypothetical protein
MSAKLVQPTREQLLFSAFASVPQKIGAYPIRRISPYTYSLLETVESPLLGRGDPATVIDSVAEFIWMHSADVEEVIKVESRADFPTLDIRRISISLDIGESFAFVNTLTEALLRVAAAVAEEDTDTGKTTEETKEPAPIGSPLSSSPPDALETLPENVISFILPPLSEPSNSSTPPTSPQESGADGETISQETETPLELPSLPIHSQTCEPNLSNAPPTS